MPAMNALGAMYEHATDYITARRCYEVAALNDSGEGMRRMGNLYAEGHGVKQNYSVARSWYMRSIEMGDATGMYRLGKLYYYGHVGQKDVVQAAHWLSLIHI